jgi:hypothetical protein
VATNRTEAIDYGAGAGSTSVVVDAVALRWARHCRTTQTIPATQASRMATYTAMATGALAPNEQKAGIGEADEPADHHAQNPGVQMAHHPCGNGCGHDPPGEQRGHDAQGDPGCAQADEEAE